MGSNMGVSHIYLHSNDRYYMAIPGNTMTRYKQGVMCSGSDCRTACLLLDMMKGGTVCIMGSEPTAWLGDMSLTQWILVQLRYLSGHWRKSKQVKSKSILVGHTVCGDSSESHLLHEKLKPRLMKKKRSTIISKSNVT